jgi:hypothetical protein
VATKTATIDAPPAAEPAEALAGLECRISALQKELEQRTAVMLHAMHSVRQSVHALQRTRPAGKRPKVLFLVHHLEAWDALAGVHDALKQAEDFVPLVASIPRRMFDTGLMGDEARVSAGLDDHGVPHLRLNMDSFEALDIIRAIAPEIIFRQSPWEADVPPGFRTAELSMARLCYVPYGMMTARFEQRQFDQYFHRMCWRYFCATEAEGALFARHAVRGGAQAVVTGYPKFDHLLQAANAPDAWPIGQGARNTRIVWAPHHSVEQGGLGFSTFAETMMPVLEAAATDPALEIVLKPHPALFERCRQYRLVPPDVLEGFLEAWRMLPNTLLVEGNDYGPLFAASDAMVTDGVSPFSEYMLFDKPLIWIDSGRHVGFNEAGALLQQGMYRVPDWAGAAALIERVVRGTRDELVRGTRDELAAQRRAVIAALLPYPGQAAARIVQALRDGLAEERA